MIQRSVWPISVIVFLLAALMLVPGLLPVQAQPSPPATDPAAAPAADLPARVLVAHLAPFAADDATVTVQANGGDLLTDFTYKETSDYLELDSGSYTIGIIPDGATDPAITGTVTLDAGEDYTAAAIGDGTNQPLELLPLADDNSPPMAGNAKLRIVHTAPFTETLAATEVDIRTDAGDVVGGLTNVPYKGNSGYLELPAGEYDLKITAPGDPGTTLIEVPPVTLNDGDIVTVFAIGDGTNKPLEILTVAGETRAAARLSVAHLAPFAAEIGATSVSVSANGDEVLTDFTFGETTDYLDLPEGNYQLAVTPIGATDPAITGTVALAAGADYTAAAIGNATNQPLELLALEDDNSAPSAGNAKVRIVHAAPFTDTLAATEVDIRTEAGDVVGGLTNVPYKGNSGYLELPPATYDLKITAPGDPDTTLIDVPPFTLSDGDIVTVFAVGDGSNQPLNVLGVGASLGTAEVLIAHLAPFAAGDAAVTVEVNGDAVLTDFAYGNTTNYIPLPAGNYTINIIPSGASEPAITGSFAFLGGQDYTAAAIGDGTNQSLDLLVLLDDNSPPATGNAKVRIVHAAPFATDAVTLASTAVDVLTEDNNVVLANVAFGDISDYLSLEPGTYDLKITAAGDPDTTLIDLAPFTLKAGDIVTVYAVGVGEGGNQPLGGLRVSGQTLRIFLPIVVN
jgi:hypothetical protein